LDRSGRDLSLRTQCDLLGVNRSGLYYEPVPVSDENLLYMRLLYERYTEDPTWGVLHMTAHLRRQGYPVNEKRVRRLLRIMGLEAVYQKPDTRRSSPEHSVYPYLLKGVEVTRSNQVWSTDITYIPMKKGFVYLMAVMDWYSRHVLDWEVSTTLEADFCIETVGRLLERQTCEIFNTDQGAQFTTPRFTQPLLARGVCVSMDGRGRAFDNIFIERLWRTVKYDYVYLHDIQTVSDLRVGLGDFFDRYNYKRLHQSLGYRTPAEVYQADLNSRNQGGL
jgi:putative transposase